MLSFIIYTCAVIGIVNIFLIFLNGIFFKKYVRENKIRTNKKSKILKKIFSFFRLMLFSFLPFVQVLTFVILLFITVCFVASDEYLLSKKYDKMIEFKIKFCSGDIEDLVIFLKGELGNEKN